MGKRKLNFQSHLTYLKQRKILATLPEIFQSTISKYQYLLMTRANILESGDIFFLAIIVLNGSQLAKMQKSIPDMSLP